jgi:hypothetical protein
VCLQRTKRSADSQVAASAACASGAHSHMSQGQLPFDRTDNPLLRNEPVHSPGHIAGMCEGRETTKRRELTP